MRDTEGFPIAFTIPGTDLEFEGFEPSILDDNGNPASDPAAHIRVTLESLKILAQHDVGLISITEKIDYSTVQGKLFTLQMLGSFAEYSSESLATHVRKGQGQRARDGRHLGRYTVRVQVLLVG